MLGLPFCTRTVWRARASRIGQFGYTVSMTAKPILQRISVCMFCGMLIAGSVPGSDDASQEGPRCRHCTIAQAQLPPHQPDEPAGEHPVAVFPSDPPAITTSAEVANPHFIARPWPQPLWSRLINS
jgi:hypothetical protein